MELIILAAVVAASWYFQKPAVVWARINAKLGK